MKVGASTANLYPALTEEALDSLLRMGFRELEVFVNTDAEIAPAYIRGLRRRADEAGARICAMHPFLSGMEPYLLFSAYERRYQDGLRYYARLFEATAELGASFMVMHGDKADGVLPVEESIARYEGVYDLGRTYGVTLAQENVVRFRAGDIAYLSAMRRQLGDKAHFVFDAKQARRCGYTAAQVIAAMGGSIAHVHISDADEAHDCLLPGRGREDLRALLSLLARTGFDGSLMIELYRTNFETDEDLCQGKQVIEKLLFSEFS